MNKLLIIALLTVVATPAFAQSRVHVQSSNNVYSYQGDLIGSDPDANVRASLLKDYHAL